MSTYVNISKCHCIVKLLLLNQQYCEHYSTIQLYPYDRNINIMCALITTHVGTYIHMCVHVRMYTLTVVYQMSYNLCTCVHMYVQIIMTI